MTRRSTLAFGLSMLMVVGLAASRLGGNGPHRVQPRVPNLPPAVKLAPSPPMGWNSWDCYGTSVREEEVKANADYMARNLSSFGWQYVVVDIQWYEPNAEAHGYRENADLVMDEYGRLLPAPNRFPSAAQGRGFRPLADYVHSKGLKFGIHIMRGIPRLAVKLRLPVLGTSVNAPEIADTRSLCAWNTDMYGVDTSSPSGQAYYDSIVQLYANWGVDFITADDMTEPYHVAEIEALSNAIKRVRRPIVLSLSPGPTDTVHREHVRSQSQLWRISNDFWDRWPDLKAQFSLCRKWEDAIGPDSWPDADMLPLGRIGIRAEQGEDRLSNLTQEEQLTLMTLWSVFRSPLMFGGDLPSNDEFTLRLLTNREVLAVNQNSARNRELFAKGDQIAWIADIPESSGKYLAVFNLADNEASVEVSWSDLGLPEHCRLRDLWQRQDLEASPTRQSFRLGPHACRLLKVLPAI